MPINNNHKHFPLEYWAVFMTSMIMAIILVVLCVHVNNSISIKPDTLLLVGGNFVIAYWISSIINKKHKNNELKISNCFEELDSLLLLLNELRTTIKNDNFDDDYSFRSMSIINLQIDLIKQYSFINKEHMDALFEDYKKLNISLTGESEINDNYKISLLNLEKKILVIKSQIL